MKILGNLSLKKQYSAAIKRKDKQIEELKKANEVLQNILLKKERELLELKNILHKAQKAL